MCCREVVRWKNLSHPNVLSLSGIIMSNNEFSLVSEWMDNGNINQFMKAHRNVNRNGLVGFQFYCWTRPPLMTA